MMAGKGKKMKLIRKDIERKLLDNFRETHFGILPLSKLKLENICKLKGLNPKVYDLNPNTGLIRNTCMSENCLYYMQPMSAKEISDHLKLWHG